MRLELNYDVSNFAIRNDVDSLDRRRYIVRSMVPTGYEEYFRNRARFASAHTTTLIEGNPLDAIDAYQAILRGARSDAPNEIEAENAEQAYQFVNELGADRSLTIDQGIIRAFNSILLRGLPSRASRNRGTYRPGGAQVVDPSTRDVKYNPAPPEWVPSLMASLIDDLQKWLENEPAPIAAAKVHFGLASIHPFEDGNGRTARLVADLVLVQSGWSVDGMISVSKILSADRNSYYEALNATQGLDFEERVDVTRFLGFHTKALLAAASELEDDVVDFKRRNDSLMARLSSKIHPRQVTGIFYLIDLGPLSTATYARLNECSRSAALADLNELVSLDVARREGKGRNTVYRIHPNIGTAESDGQSSG